MQISISSLSEGIQQQQVFSASAGIWSRLGSSQGLPAAISSQAPDSYSTDALRQLVAGYAPASNQSSTGSSNPAVNMGSLQADGIQQLAHQVLQRLMHLTIGAGAVPNPDTTSTNDAANPPSGAGSSDTAQSGLSQEVATDNSIAGAMIMKGTITADNGSVYNFSMAVQVGKETATDTQMTTSGNSSTLGSVSASALVMQSQVSLSYAGTVQGTGDTQNSGAAQGQGAGDGQVGDVMQGLQDVATAFAAAVLGDGQNGSAQPAASTQPDLSSTSGNGQVQAASQQSDSLPFNGTFTLSHKGAGQTRLEALFNDLNKLLNAQRDTSSAFATAGASLDRNG